MKKRILLTTLLVVLLAVLASACGPAQPAGLTEDEVLVVTSQVLQAIDDGDYAAFTQDFSPDMLAAFPESQFNDLATMLHNASGNFAATGKVSLSNNQGYAVYRIICAYALEDVVVTIVFKIDGVQVEGLFFDSPNLRAASK